MSGLKLAIDSKLTFQPNIDAMHQSWEGAMPEMHQRDAGGGPEVSPTHLNFGGGARAGVE